MVINVDYATSYFSYPNPTLVRGESTNKVLKWLKNDSRANASSVKYELGDGEYGYFGLVLTDAKYTCLSGKAFFVPNFPPALTVPTTATYI